MALRQTRVSVSEIEALRRRLGELALSKSALPDEVLEKFERLLTVAHDELRQEEAVQLATQLYQFSEGQQRPALRRRSSGPASVTVQLEPPLVAALDAFAQERDELPSRPEAVRLILAAALTAHGLLPAPESSDLNGR